MCSQAMATKFGGKFGPSVRHMEVTAEYTRALSTEASQGCRSSACCSRQRVHYSVLFLFDGCVQRMRKRKNLWSVLELPTAPRDHMWGHTRWTQARTIENVRMHRLCQLLQPTSIHTCAIVCQTVKATTQVCGCRQSTVRHNFPGRKASTASMLTSHAGATE